MDFLIHWPPGPVVATVQCQGLLCEAKIDVDGCGWMWMDVDGCGWDEIEWKPGLMEKGLSREGDEKPGCVDATGQKH